MVKISGNNYFCEWCGEKITHIKHTTGRPREYGPNPFSRSSGHARVSSALICPNPECKRVVSQRRSDGSK